MLAFRLLEAPLLVVDSCHRPLSNPVNPLDLYEFGCICQPLESSWQVELLKLPLPRVAVYTRKVNRYNDTPVDAGGQTLYHEYDEWVLLVSGLGRSMDR
jgi:hypothetical protein